MLKVTLMDLVTGQIAVYPDTDIPYGSWTDSNWSCDCNRAIAFPNIEKELKEQNNFMCYGKKRIIVINASGDEVNALGERSEFIEQCNEGYVIPEDFKFPVYSDLCIADMLNACDCPCHKRQRDHLHGEEPCCGISGMNYEEAREALRETGQYVEPTVTYVSAEDYDAVIDAIENPKPMTDEVKARWAQALSKTMKPKFEFTNAGPRGVDPLEGSYKAPHFDPIPEDIDLEWDSEDCCNCEPCTCGAVPGVDEASIISLMLDDVQNTPVEDLKQLLKDNADGPIYRAVNPDNFGDALIESMQQAVAISKQRKEEKKK